MRLLKDALVLIRVEESILLKSDLKITERLKFFFNQWKSVILDKREINYFGKKFVYDKRTEAMLLGEYPQEIMRIIKPVKKENIRTAIDIGANIGQWGFTIKSICPQIKLYSFEPNPAPFKLLLSNSSKFRDWKVFNYGIDEKDGKRKMYFSPQATAEGTYHKENLNQNYVRSNIKEEVIKTLRLNKKNIKRLGMPKKIDLVKIDVEGAELEVLKGLGNIDFRYLYIETSVGRKGSTKEEVISFLEKNWGKKAKVLFTNRPSKYSSCENSLIVLQ